MAETRRSFHQVKSLLGKMDRSIDEARSRRLGIPDEPERPSVRSSDADALETVIGRSETSGPEPEQGPAGDEESPGGPRRSVYGRARPLNRPNSTTQWSSP